MREHALAFHKTRPAAGAVHGACDVGWHDVLTVCQGACRRRRGRSRHERRRLKSRKISSDLITRLRMSWTAAAQRRPRLVIPRDDVARRIETHTLVDDKREAEVFVCHLIFARQLHAYRTADGL